MAIFRWGLPNGGVECRGYKKSRFSTSISLYLRNDTRYVLYSANRKPCPSFRMVPFSM